eukprot:gene34173-44151_t
MTAGILAILQGTLTLSLSVTGYYATLTAIFPIAVLTLRFFIPTKEPLRKQEEYYPLLSLQLLNASLAYGIVPSLLSYACGKFEHKEKFQLLSATLVSLSAVLVLCAALPEDSGYGGALPVTAYVCIGALFGFSNTCMFRYFKQELGTDESGQEADPAADQEHGVQRAYKLAGLATQIGAFIGSIITFALIVTNSF